MSIQELVRANVQKMEAYSSARDENSGGVIQLDANENPYSNGLNRYPDPYQSELKEKIAGLWSLSAKNLVLGNGSDELIDLLIRAFCEPGIDNVIALTPSYGMYRVCSAVNDVEYREVALNAQFDLEADLVLSRVNRNTKLIFLCSPNNPTGNSLNMDEVQRLLNEFQGIVIVDEAYVDFSEQISWSKDLDNNTQLVVLQTLSKAFSMAALRIGLAWCDREIVEVLNKIKPPYNINLLSQQTAIQILDGYNKTQIDIERIKESRGYLSQELNSLSFVSKVFPSASNFLLVRVEDAFELYEFLLKRGVVVRNRSSELNCENCLRISVGSKEENIKLLEILKIYQDEKSIIYR